MIAMDVFIGVICAYFFIKGVESAIAAEREYRAKKKALTQQKIDHDYRRQCRQEEQKRAAKSALVPVPSSALERTGSQAPARLGDLLVKEKVITPEQLEQATKFQKDTHTRLESALVKLGFLSDEDVTNFLSSQYGVPAINNLSYLEIDPAVVKLIPYETAKWLQILPLSRVGASLTIAMVDPTNVFAMDEVKFMTGFNIEPVVASGSSIIEGIDKAYDTSKDGTRKVERVDLADGREGF